MFSSYMDDGNYVMRSSQAMLIDDFVVRWKTSQSNGIISI